MFILVGLQENTHTMIEKTKSIKNRTFCAIGVNLKNYAFFKLARYFCYYENKFKIILSLFLCNKKAHNVVH